MVGLIRTIIIIGAIYYGLKLLVRYLFPFLLKTFVRRQQAKYSNARNSQEPTSNSDPINPPKRKDDLGDYVEYEEIED